VRRGSLSGVLNLAFEDPLHPVGRRQYALYVPKAYNPDSPMPLLLDFHGFYDDDDSEAHEDGVHWTAELEGFAVAYPNGLADNPDDPSDWWNSWNGGGTSGSDAGLYGQTCIKDHSKYPCYRSCARAGVCKINEGMRRDCGCSGCADDVGFVSALLTHLKNELCLDTERIHGTGMSNGAIFLYYLATTASVGPQLASIVPVEGSFILGFLDPPKVPMPVIDIHGIRDDCVPANVSNSWGKYKRTGCPVDRAGRNGCTVGDDGWLYHPVHEIMARWATANGCPADGKPTQAPTRHDGKTGWSCVMPFGDRCGAPVHQCTHNLAHTWPFHVGQGKKGRRSRLFGEALWDFMRDKRRSQPTDQQLSLVV